MVRFCLVILISACFFSGAGAQGLSGQDLANMCEKRFPNNINAHGDRMFCAGFINGIISYASLVRRGIDRPHGAEVVKYLVPCIPNDIETAEAKETLLKYLNENPKKRVQPALFTTTEAFKKAYPCIE